MLPRIAFLASLSGVLAQGLQYDVTQTAPFDASKIASNAPIGVSLEFFEFPDYMQKLPLTKACLRKLGEAMGASPPLRIGGTSQDAAVFNTSLAPEISYRWPDDSHKGVPLDLQFGTKFVDLAASYDGSVTFGVNRRMDDIDNTISAAKAVKSEVGNLYALEIGNEPNFYKDSDPIAENKAWNAQADFASQVKWQSSISDALDEKEPFVQAGVYYGQGAFNTTGLSTKEQEADTLKDVQSFCHHYYPQGGPTYNLSELVDHQSTVNDIAEFAPLIENARQLGKEFVFGETNSANQGGVEGLSDTYGAALWLVDYTMQAVKHGVKHLLFHHGTIGQCGYCWWQDSVEAPFYGAYMGALTLSKASKIVQLDSGKDRHAAYALYDNRDKLLRILLLNTEFHTSGNQQQSMEVKLSGFSQRVRHLYATRLTADATDAVAGNGTISIAGQRFTGDECGLEGQENTEAVKVRNGKAMVTLKTSEAVLLDFQA